MQKIHFSIKINAPKEKVWYIMLNDATYRQWTEAFHPGSYFEGSWEQGSDIKFLGPDEQGGLGGMFSKIKENRPYEFMSIDHLGEIINGEKKTASDWSSVNENYTFTETNGVTEVAVEMDSLDQYKEMFEEMWPKALQKVKEISEKTTKAITVETTVNAPLEKVWECWNEPKHITKWAFASDDWEAPSAENDIRTGGQFKTVMAAKNKSFSFDFSGVYTNIKQQELIEYIIGDGRSVKIQFTKLPDGVKVTETFEMEGTHTEEQQRSGWQSILENFRKHTEQN